MTLRKAYADLAEGQLHYAFAPGDGTPLIFFHQTASSWKMWAKVASLVRSLGAPIYAFDTPGFGGSFDPVGATSMPRYAAWMAEAFEVLGIRKAHVIGHHTGAAIACQLVTDRPDLAASVMMVGPVALTPAERAEFAKTAGPPFVPEMSGAYLLDNWKYLTKLGGPSDALLVHREVTDMLRAYQGRSDAYGAVWEQDFIALYQSILCPIAIACASDDILWPFFERARTLRPNATAVEFPGGANFEPDLVPEAVAEAIVEFVTRHG